MVTTRRDELTRRLRDLEAERLRPAPPAPTAPDRPTQGRMNLLALMDSFGGPCAEDLELLRDLDARSP